MRIAIGNDHAATALKFEIMEYVKELGHEVVNFGTDTNDSCNYPEIGARVGHAVVEEGFDCGILICGTGVGISIAANKVKGVRAGVCLLCIKGKKRNGKTGWERGRNSWNCQRNHLQHSISGTHDSISIY